MSSDPKWFEERAEALAKGDTWPRTQNLSEKSKEDEKVEKKITNNKK